MRALLALLLLAGPAAAGDFCDDLWYARNAIFHEAGYCFGSELGQAVFGNEGCTGTSPSLTDDQRSRLERIRANEEGCNVSTSRSSLALDDFSIRQSLSDQPIRWLGESACLGWTGEPLALRAGHSLAARLTGELARGDDVMFAYENENAQGRSWHYVQTWRDGSFRSAGWVVIEAGPEVCTELAG